MCSPNTISYTWDTYSFANGQSRIVKSLGLDTWYFVAVDYALGKSLVAEASDAIARSGGKVVGTVWHRLVPPRIFSGEGALIRRADVAFDV